MGDTNPVIYIVKLLAFVTNYLALEWLKWSHVPSSEHDVAYSTWKFNQLVL